VKIKIIYKETGQELGVYDNIELIVPTSHYLKIWFSNGALNYVPYKSHKIQVINDNDKWKAV